MAAATDSREQPESTDARVVSNRGSQLTFWDMERRQTRWAPLIRKFAWYSEQGGEAARSGLAFLERARFLAHEWHRIREG